MIKWSVVPSAAGGWSVAVTEGDGAARELRGRFVGLPCIGAQVIAAELERAYRRGREDEREDLASTVLGD